MTPEQRMARAQRVQAILDDPLQKEAWESLRGRLRDIAADAKTDAAAMKAREMLRLLNDVHGYWTRILNDGAITAKEIELEKEEAKRRWWQRAA